MLYLVPTPIGNLADFTYRAVEILRNSSYILCEDTRHSKTLLDHYQISSSLRSFHQFNEAKMEETVIQDLLQGKQIAVISDAGTPGICDPAARLVARCRSEGIAVSALPGACALVTALVASGLPTERFQFLGFSPRTEMALKAFLLDLLVYPGVSLFYEAPHRLLDTLKALNGLRPQAEIAIARELSKKFEEFQKGTAQTLLLEWMEREVKGELVVMIQGTAPEADWINLPVEQHVALLEPLLDGDRKAAIKMAAEQRGLKRRDVYQQLLAAKPDAPEEEGC